MKYYELILKRLMPTIPKSKIKNYLKYEKAVKQIKTTEKDFEFVNNELAKIPEEEIKKVGEEINNPMKKLIEDANETLKELEQYGKQK